MLWNVQMEAERDIAFPRMERLRARVPSYLRTLGRKQVGFSRIVRAVALEYIATTLFVFYACGSVVASTVYLDSTITSGENPEKQTISVAQNLFAAIIQGFAIATLVYAISHTSGGHINPAVTLALMISRNIGILRGLFYILFQLLGGITGAALLSGFLPGNIEGHLGTTNIGEGLSPFQGYLFEFVITFGLIFTIFGTALNKEAAASGTSSLAPLPIGFSVTVGVGIAFTFTGGSMNPARTFGPAVISHSWSHHYIYWFGPFTASLLVGLLELFFSLFSQGQHAVFRASAIRNRREIREAAASSVGKAAARKPSIISAVPVILEPGTEPVNMIPMVNPEHPERPFMVPVATNEQLGQLTDELDETHIILRSPPPEPGPSYFSRRMSLLGQPGTKGRRKSTQLEPKRRGSLSHRPSSAPSVAKSKLSLVPPAPLDDFSYLSDESLEDFPASSSTALLRPTSAPTSEIPDSQNIPVVTISSPKNSPATRPSRLNHEPSPKNSPTVRPGRNHSPRTASPHLTAEYKAE